MKAAISSIGIFLLLIFLSGCSVKADYKAEDIQQIQLSITGGPIENYCYVLNDEENIKEALKVAKRLETYKSPDISTWFVDISYHLIFKDGKETSLVYKKIRPYDELLKSVLTSAEVRQQDLDLYKVDTKSIETLTLSSETKEPVVIERTSDETLLENLTDSLKDYYLSDAYLDEERIVNPSCTIEVSLSGAGKVIEGYYIFSNNEEAIQLLKNKGLYEDLVVIPEDMETLILQKEDQQIILTDKHLIQLVLDSYQDFHDSRSLIDVEYTLKKTSGHHLTQYGSLLKGHVPSEIKELFR